MGTKGFCLIWYHHTCFSYLFPFHLNFYVMGLQRLYIFNSFSAGIGLRRLILTSKDDCCTKRANVITVLSRARQRELRSATKPDRHFFHSPLERFEPGCHSKLRYLRPTAFTASSICSLFESDHNPWVKACLCILVPLFSHGANTDLTSVMWPI